jgi:hypothetical protein
VASGSHRDFAETISSWHPRKRPRLELARDRLSRVNACPRPRPRHDGRLGAM